MGGISHEDWVAIIGVGFVGYSGAEVNSLPVCLLLHQSRNDDKQILIKHGKSAKLSTLWFPY